MRIFIFQNLLNMKKPLLTLLAAIPLFSIAQPGITSLLSNASKATLQQVQQPQTVPQGTGEATNEMNERLRQESLHFTENKGQVTDIDGKPSPDILFTAHSRGVKLFITATGIFYQFNRIFEKKKNESEKETRHSKFDTPEVDSTQLYRLDMQLIGANKHPQILKEGEGRDYENYYVAHCPNGILGVKNYGRIIFKNVYPDIDWVLYSKDGTMEYDFLVHPGADIKHITMQYTGASNLQVEASGGLKITTPLGTVQEHAPVSLQGSKEIQSRFRVKNNTVGFEVNGWDEKEELRIDPSVDWATYYGGTSSDFGYSTAIDGSGNVYLAGTTFGSAGLGYNGFHNLTNGSWEAILVKFDAAGARIWATYYGGNSFEEGFSCATDVSGNIYLAGTTGSDTGVASTGFQNTYGGGSDGFLVKFNSNGARLWGTYYGGTGGEEGYCCATDITGNVYVTGRTSSATGIASGGFQNTYGNGQDAFIVKFNSNGARLWASYYGASGEEIGNSCAADASGNIYLAGTTTSTTGIASGGVQNAFGGYRDGFLVKFSSSGARLWATYYGGTATEEGYSCTTDVLGNVYLAGSTASVSAIASGGFQNVHGGGYNDGFVAKFNSSGARQWATYFGGAGHDEIFCCATDEAGYLYIAGETYSANGIAYAGFQNAFIGVPSNYSDAFFARFKSSGARVWATYYGGGLKDIGNSCTPDALGSVYFAGTTNSTTNIASGGVQNINGGNQDFFLAHVIDCTSKKPTITSNVPITTDLCLEDTIVLTSSPAPAYYWSNNSNTRSITVKAVTDKYSVVTENSEGCTNISNKILVSFIPCNPPKHLNAKAKSSQSAKLNWHAVNCGLSYKVQYRKKGVFAPWERATTSDTVILLTGLSPNTIYEWEIATKCQDDLDLKSEYAEGPDFTTPSAITQQDNNMQSPATVSKATLFPNPTTGNATLFLSGNGGKTQVVITDISGKIIWQSSQTTERSMVVPSQNFAPGIYMINIKGNQQTGTLKLVKE